MQVHYACIAFLCTCIALVPLPPETLTSEIMKKNNLKKTQKGTKAEGSVGLGKERKVAELQDQAAFAFLLNGDAREFMKVMHPDADEASLDFYTDVFSYFQIDMDQDTYFRILNFLYDNNLMETGDKRLDYFIDVVLNHFGRKYNVG